MESRNFLQPEKNDKEPFRVLYQRYRQIKTLLEKQTDENSEVNIQEKIEPEVSLWYFNLTI
jgi:hypothetical protein